MHAPRFSNMKFERITNYKVEANTCKRMDHCLLDTKIKSEIATLRTITSLEDEVAEHVHAKYNITIDYAKQYMAPKAVQLRVYNKVCKLLVNKAYALYYTLSHTVVCFRFLSYDRALFIAYYYVCFQLI